MRTECGPGADREWNLSHWKTFHMLRKHGARELNLLYDSSPVNYSEDVGISRRIHCRWYVRSEVEIMIGATWRTLPSGGKFTSMSGIVSTAED